VSSELTGPESLRDEGSKKVRIKTFIKGKNFLHFMVLFPYEEPGKCVGCNNYSTPVCLVAMLCSFSAEKSERSEEVTKNI